MDSTSDFLTTFQNWLMSVDEDYLIGIANKGLYNRALKELGENPEIKVDLAEQFITCTLPDGTTCNLTNDLQKLTCTCPSRSICKHVLVSLLYLKQKQWSEASNQSDSPADFSSLLTISPLELRKLSGDKAYWESVLRLDFGIKAEISEGSLLVIKFNAENISVRFPPQDPLQNSICSCKSQDFCRHRVEALIHYQLAKGGVTREDLARDRAYKLSAKTLTDVKKLLEEMLELGLSRLPDTVTESVEQAAVICHSSDLPNLEKLLRSLKGELELYFSKKATFSREKTRKRIAVIYATVLALENEAVRADLVGEHKSTYFDIPPLEIHGMGAEGWSTKSGYEGITYYFLMQGTAWLTYSNSRPTFYEQAKVDFARMYKGSPPWNVEGSCGEFSKSKVKLVNAKINSQGRLSSSEQTKATLLNLTKFEGLETGEKLFEDWVQLLDKLTHGLAFSLQEAEENFNLVLIKPNKWGQGSFDKIKQQFTLAVQDAGARSVEITVTFTAGTKKLIENLENFSIVGHPQTLLGRVYVKDGGLKIFPITAFYADGRIVNLTLEDIQQL